MTNPKITHKTKKPRSPVQESRQTTAEVPSENPPADAAGLTEALDRLGQKLDAVTGVFREQAEAWRQFREPASGIDSARQTSDEHDIVTQTPEGGSTPPATGAERPGQPTESQETNRATPASRPRLRPASGPATLEPASPPADQRDQHATTDGGIALVTEDARRLVDTLGRSGSDWRDQAASLHQALQAIMTFLENQAASATPPLDISDIMSRLKNLEDQQKNLASQISANRWGP